MRNVTRFDGGDQWVGPAGVPTIFGYRSGPNYSMLMEEWRARRAHAQANRRDDSIDFAGMPSVCKLAPYQPGDVTYALTGGRRQLVRIIRVSAHHLNSGEAIPRYRVQTVNLDHNWSMTWRWIYPGDIYRGHFDERGDLLPGLINEDAENGRAA